MGRISDAAAAFSKIYAENTWGKGSGIGSEPAQTVEYVKMLQGFLVEYNIRSVVDFGCGDWQFSKLIDWTGIRYHGFDIVPSVVAANQQTFAAENISFHVAEPGARLPSADLVLCKDVLQHLPVSEVRRHLDMFKRLYTHMLITNDIFPEHNLNVDIEPGQCRPLRLDCAPFHEAIQERLRWEINAYGSFAIKQTAHLRGALEAPPSYIVLIDPPDAIAAPRRAARQWFAEFRAVVGAVPVLGPAARAVWRFLRGRA
jgi:SAM-dependent methyltransferase